MSRPLRLATLPLTLTLLLALFAAPAGAHTSARDFATEGQRRDNALAIGHGCEESDKSIVAQIALFPGTAPEISTDNPGIQVADLSEIIEQGSLAGLVRGIQDRGIFGQQDEKLDANGNSVGFVGSKGRMKSNLRGRVPFEFTAPHFVPESRATRLIVHIAIADICKRKGGVDADHVNLWIPDNGSEIATEAAAEGVDGVGDPGVLIVNRDQASNPIDGACEGGFSATVAPSAEQIDAELPTHRVWP